MRKAFKFSADCKKTSKGSRSKNKVEKNGEKNGFVLEMPFRKNSSEKTMNSQFLRQVFSNQEFLVDYEQFLGIIYSINVEHLPAIV